MIKFVSLLVCWCLVSILAGCGEGGTQATPKSLSIVSLDPPEGTVGIAYGGTQAFSFIAIGGAAPYSWSWSAAGSWLPPGLSLSAKTGTIAGIPTAPAVYTFKVDVHDSSSPVKQTSSTYTLSITDPTPLAITSPTPPDSILGALYGGTFGFSLTASGGVAPYAWNWAPMGNSSLPSGLTLSPSTGVISGTTTTVGSFNFTITVSDSESPAAEMVMAYSISVNQAAGLRITSGPLPSGKVGVRYGGSHSFQGHSFTGFPLSATGGNRQYKWSAVSLPPGLGIQSIYISGGATRCCVYIPILEGTPTTIGNEDVLITVTDSASPPAQASANYNVTIQP